MHQFSSHPKYANLFIFFIVTIPMLGTACSGSARAVESQPTLSSSGNSFIRSGFEVTGFTDRQERIIKQVLAAYERALGGQRKLKGIISVYHHGRNQMITYAPNRVGANADIQLSSTVFSREKSILANFSCYAVEDDETYAQVVIGHEIGHVLIHGAKLRTGIDWAELYQQRIDRDWQAIGDPKAPLEEAVTEFSLMVLQQGYYFSIDEDIREADPEILAQIDAWASDFLSALQRME